MNIRLLPIATALFCPILATGDEPAAIASDSAAPAPASEVSAQPRTCFFRMPKLSSFSLETQVLFSRGEGPSYQFAHGLDEEYDQAFSIMMRGIASVYSPFTWSIPEDTHAKGNLVGAKAAFVLEPCRIGTFSIEAGFLAGNSDSSLSKALFSGSGVLGGDTMSFEGYLGRDYSMDSRSFSLAVFWEPPCLGKWVSFGLEGARGDNDLCYNMYYEVVQTLNGETSGYNTSARFDADLAVYDVLLHARANLHAIPLRGFADGRLSLLPEADLAAGYSFRDLHNVWETDFYNGEKGMSWNLEDGYPVDDVWILRGYAGLTLLYELQDGTLSFGGGYRYDKDLNGGKAETTGALVRLGYKRCW
jgi:hypothetical protein